MKIKIDQPIKNFDGSDLEPEKGKALTYRKVIENAINLQSEAQPLTAEKKLKGFQIGIKLNAKKLEAYDLTVDQVGFIKERVGLFYTPIIYGRFLELIGDEVVEKEKKEE